MAVVKLRGKIKLRASIASLKVLNNKQKHAIITVGIPGSGKTTWAEQQQNYINLNLDDFREKISGNAADQNVNKLAVEMRDAFLKRAIKKQQNIILSDTNINPFFRERLIDQLKTAGYSIELKVFDIALEEALKRNANRSRNVPEEVIIRMYNQLKDQNIHGSSNK